MLKAPVKPTRQSHGLGRSLRLDDITRELLDDGTLRRRIDDFPAPRRQGRRAGSRPLEVADAAAD